ncbi:(2Fe-2S)-binding protein [Alteromonas facilis]|uniref:(2Fe-2S)-binding protein n=1 Tax=Alteromonas facilis TaxID=2048004 RepID=UPI000C2903CF|nr:(2Fe-2S)-binding protein [Alteromonas facilis]
MFVCMCFGVTDTAIKQAVKAHGVGNVRELTQLMQMGSDCGRCVQMAQQIIDNTIVDESLFKEVC